MNTTPTAEPLSAKGARLLTMAEVLEAIPYSRPSVYRLMRKNQFPKPLKLGPSKIAFREAEISEWLATRKRALRSPEDGA